MDESKINENISDLDRIPVKHLVSKRDIGIEAFELENGNLMLEATLLDPYHLIRLNIHIEPQTKTIVHAKSEFANHPHKGCPMIAFKAKQIIGLKIERGIVKEVSQRIGGHEGCVHLKELIIETINFAATTLIGFDQGFGLMSRRFNILNEDQRFEISKEILKNTCIIYKEK
ncbi:MAG: DUF2889 domain-containing protein [Candidatus Kapabacteria bacterium]|nr:DUF2889 domain-containing protein [Candidatus Kapabacteria bacterium]